MFTTSSIFLKSLAEAEITHVFVNWGSDHPAILEDLERQRVEEEDGTTKLKIVTCPNEMVALSAAQGYAQVTRKPAAVIVHVDVGTQALAGAVHNVDRSRTPVLIYAGAAPFSSQNEHKGSRNEWVMWLQDIPDQPAIVRQYMRFTAQISSASTISQVVKRGLQIATSDPKGPVYLWAHREVMEEEISAETLMASSGSLYKSPSIERSALNPSAAARMSTTLLSAHSPLIITSFLGRNPDSVESLGVLSRLLSIPVYLTCPDAVNIPFSYPYYAGVSYLAPRTHSRHLATADVILVIDCDLPWVPANDHPLDTARVFVIDSGNPLKDNIGSWDVGAELVCNADSELALNQLVETVRRIDEQGSLSVLDGQALKDRGEVLALQHQEMVRALDEAEDAYPEVGSSAAASITVPNILGVPRRAIEDMTPSRGLESLILNEGISESVNVWLHMRPEVPGHMFMSGGSSMLRMHPTGHGSKASGDKLSVGFGPNCPDYSQIAVAASSGWAWGKRVSSGGKSALESAIIEGVKVVFSERRCAVIDCVLESI